ncbi:MAG TPA: biopolymer transporter ExbD [Verrucomicrobiota bacterium]|nr:biopolymer transporter ExbD [Verrucomicrobiota bacterium]
MKFGHAVEHKHARIEIIPLIDIMFFLLASFMMVSLQMSKLSSVKVDMPTARSVPANQQDVNPDFFSITLDRGGDIFVGTTQVTLPELTAHMDARFPRGSTATNLPIYVVGDRDTPHGAVIGVLNVIRGAGFQRVSFSVTGTGRVP